MNAETESLLEAHAAVSASPIASRQWKSALPLLLLAIVAILAVYGHTAESIVSIWWRSETFQHGFLIVPISAWLIWLRRRDVASIAPKPDMLGLVLLLGAGMAWLVAAAGQVQVVQQYAMVAMIPAVVIAIAGRRVARALAFPLGFLFLAVPIGEVLISPLMDWTADFTVAALRLTGIPVLREGNFFTIPSGSWSVVEGCSGLRYLIASITIGVLFAYLTYTALWKRLLFIAASVIVPILANWLRAYMIVMIGHLSDMKLAHGVDHLIYGWVFFGLVMLLLFWVGSFWRDPTHDVPGKRVVTGSSPVFKDMGARFATFALAAVAVAGAWPVYAIYLDAAHETESAPVLVRPTPTAGWTADDTEATGWLPHYDPPSARIVQTYRKGDRAVLLYLAYYQHQIPGSQLVNSWNIMITQKHRVWSNVGEVARREDLGTGPVDIRETRLRSPGQRLLIWDWFHIGGQDLTNPYLAKILLARNKLLDRGDDGAAIIIAAPYESTPERAAETLRQFATEMLPSTYASLRHVEGSAEMTAR